MAELREVATGYTAANVVLTQNTEVVAVQSDPILNPEPAALVYVVGWAEVTTAASTTALTTAIRRGTTTGGTLVGERNAVQLAAAAGSTESVVVHAREQIGAIDELVYVLTIQDTAGGAAGTILQSGIIVYLL